MNHDTETCPFCNEDLIPGLGQDGLFPTPRASHFDETWATWWKRNEKVAQRPKGASGVPFDVLVVILAEHSEYIQGQ